MSDETTMRGSLEDTDDRDYWRAVELISLKLANALEDPRAEQIGGPWRLKGLATQLRNISRDATIKKLEIEHG